jgi:flavin-dependent dehydrogenase
MKQIDSSLHCDFLVAGAGYAGLCAAIQAGRLGLKTVLIEKEMRLGGNGGPNVGVGAHACMACNPYWNESGIIEEIEARINFCGARLFPTNFAYNIHRLGSGRADMLDEAGVKPYGDISSWMPLCRRKDTLC